MRRPFRLLVSLTALAVAATTAFAAAPAFADSLGNGVLNLVKAASTANPEPGTTFSYTINFGCSSTTTGCVDATITDPVPAPLTIVGTPTVVGAGTSDVSVSGNTVTVAFKDAVPNTVPPSIGLAAGTTGTVTVQVKVPDDLPKSSDGQVATNTATFTATNATTKTADAPVTFRVPSVIAETVTKSWDPSSTQYQPNATSTVSLTAQNTSNIPASSMSITEPADPADAAGVFAFYNLASLGTVTFPQGADRVQVIATVNGAPINGPPSETATLPDGVDPASVTALQFVFTSSTGAPIAAGGSAGGVDLTVAQRSTNRSTGDALVNGGTRTNQAGGHIVTADGPADAPPATAQQVVSPLTATVGASKKFATTEIPAGESTSAVITAENTSTGPLDTLSVAEPGTGSFFTADVGFAGFDNAQSAWPAGATSAHVEWTVNTGSTPSDSPFTETSGLPETPALSAGQYITGFKIVYKGAVASGSEAKIGVKVSTTTSAGPAGSGFTAYPNTATITGSNPAGTATANGTDELRVYHPTIDLTLNKTISPATVVPGGSSLVQLSAQTPSGTSSVRPSTIVITEPQNPGSAYWNAFNATAIAPTSVPNGSTLTIEYTTDGTTFHTLTVVDATGGTKQFSASLSSLLPNGVDASSVQGLRFTFHDADGFGQATNVKPGIVFTARSQLRDGSGPTNPGTYPQSTPYENCALSTATGSVAGGPEINSDPATSCAQTNVQATNGGPGSTVADKSWDAPKVLQSQSKIVTGATLGWGTVVSGDKTITVQDPATMGPVNQSVYDAFDLARIDPITATKTSGATWDPLIQWDAVSTVELYNGTGWVDITAQACSLPALCDGRFPGYTLTDQQRQTTTGVRLTFVESPSRASRIQSTGDPTAPPVGSGVASASAGAFPGADAGARTLHLDLQLRDQKRSDGDWVTQAKTYNAGVPGAVTNTVGVTAVPFTGNPTTNTADDTVLLVDPALTTKATKSVSPASFVIPQPDVPSSAYPTAVYTTTVQNSSPTNTWQLRLSDPTGCSNAGTTDACAFGAYDAASNPFEHVNLTHIDITIPPSSGVQAGKTLVTLWHRANDGTLTTSTATVAEAEAMTAQQLTDVVGVDSLFLGTNAGGADNTGGTIAPNATMTVKLSVQLRPVTRSGNTAQVPGSVPNTTFAALHDPVLPTDATDSASKNLTLQNGNLAVSTSKTFNPTSTVQANPANPIQVNLRGRSTGTIAPKVLSIEDVSTTFWNAFTLSGVQVLAAPTGADRVQIALQTGTTANPIWTTGPLTTIANAAVPNVPLDQVIGVRVIYTTASGAAFPATNDTDLVRLNMQLRTQLRDGSGPVTSTDGAAMPGETAPGTVTDTVDANAQYNDITAGAHNNAAFTVSPGTATVAVEKTTPGQAAAGKLVPFTLRVKNTGTGPLVNPVITDTLPADGSLLFVPTDVPSYSTSKGGTLPTDAASVTRTFDQATGAIRFSWPAGATMAPGETYSITLTLQIKPGLAPAYTALNSFGVTNDRTLSGCTALNPGNKRPVTFVGNTCSTNNVVTTLSQGSFTASKGVRGASGNATNVNNASTPCTPDTDGYYRYPCAATSVVGGTDRWKLELTNGGNVAARSLTAIDVFPYPGDIGIVDPSPRGSTFTPRFNGDLALDPSGPAAGARMDWFVTTDASPCNADIQPTGSCPAGAWSPSSAVGSTIDAADVTAIKMVFDFSGVQGGVLPPAGSLQVTYTSTNIPTTKAGDDRAPVTAPVTDARAWNSFAFYPRYVSGEQPAGPQEPIKSGVVLSGGPLSITKAVKGAAAGYAPDSFAADITCTVDGATVDLGAQKSVVLDKEHSFIARVDGIPLGSTCAVTEHGNAGSYGESSRSVTPSSVTIVSAAGPDGSVPAAQSATITNNYDATSLTVTKHVDTAATVGSFGPFGFTLTCTAPLGQDVPLSAGDSSFTLVDGASHTVGGLPIGASCELNETDADGAQISPNSVAITVNGSGPVAGTSADITLSGQADGNVAVVTNHYAAGQLAVTKTVDGDAAGTFGDGPFAIAVRCTYDGQLLYDDSISISGGETKTIPGIFPAGTECATVETDNGGATGSTVDAPTVVIPGPAGGAALGNVTVDVTNTFSAGKVSITKKRTGDGVDSYGAGPFSAQLVCTWVKSGQTLTIPLANGGIVSLDKDNGYTATIEGLIQGAHCDTTEILTGGATSTTISPAAGVTVPAGDPAAVTITNTFDTGSLVIDKKRVGAGAEKFGAGPFTAQVSCTYLKDGQTVPVHLSDDGTVRLSADNQYTATIGNLPIGADCVVAETDQGLATASTLDPPDGAVTIGDKPVTVTITNTFDVGHLTIDKTVDHASARVGSTVVYTITVRNDGQIDANGVTVTDIVPAGLSLQSTSPQAESTNGKLLWTVQHLPVGTSATFTVTARVTAVGDVVNAASVSTPNGPWDPSTPVHACSGDNTESCATTTVTEPGGMADTGSNITWLLLVALGIIGIGLPLTVVARIRRRKA